MGASLRSSGAWDAPRNRWCWLPAGPRSRPAKNASGAREMTASLFAAIVPPPAAIAALAEAVEKLRATAPGLGWVAPARWHVTLCFLGPHEPNDDLLARLARVAGPHGERARPGA